MPKRRRATGYPTTASTDTTTPGGSGATDSPYTYEPMDVLSEAPHSDGGSGMGAINIDIVNQAVATAISETGPGNAENSGGNASGGGGGGGMQMMGSNGNMQMMDNGSMSMGSMNMSM